MTGRRQPPPNRPAQVSGMLLQAAGIAPAGAPDFEAVKRALEEENRRLGALPHAFRALSRRESAERELEAARKALDRDPGSAVLRLRYGQVLQTVGRTAEAIEMFRRCLDDPMTGDTARFSLAALGVAPAPEKAPAALVAGIFDSHAKTFETDLVGSLKYQGPALLEEAVRAVRPFVAGGLDICDIGCGTGLCGEVFRPWARSLVGGDIASEMLRLAQAKGIYDRLTHAEACALLDANPGAFDLIVAGDMVNYCGDLIPLANSSARALKPGGHLALTTESLAEGEGYRLTPAGRYQHADDYVERTAASAGLAMARKESSTLRFEVGEPVVTTVFVFARRA